MKKADIRNKRLSMEINQINNSTTNHGIMCRSKSDSDFTKLEAIIPGPKNSPYENGKFKLTIEATDQYPFYPAIIKFTTPIYHPNIDNAGKICLDILKMPPYGLYTPAVTLESILISIQLLLASPNPDDPLRNDAAELYKYHREQFDEKAKEYTQKHAIETSFKNIKNIRKE